MRWSHWYIYLSLSLIIKRPFWQWNIKMEIHSWVNVRGIREMDQSANPIYVNSTCILFERHNSSRRCSSRRTIGGGWKFNQPCGLSSYLSWLTVNTRGTLNNCATGLPKTLPNKTKCNTIMRINSLSKDLFLVACNFYLMMNYSKFYQTPENPKI